MATPTTPATALVTAPRFIDEADGVLAHLVGLRRSLHAQPEVGRHLPFTQRAVLDAIDGLGLEITTGTELSSVVAVLRGGRPGPTVLLRADMDALPGEELTGLPYASTNGSMHACGHDLHTAGLVGAARLLAAHRDELPGSVIFMFQPAEEGEGGAELMIAEGVLDATGERPVAAYAIHVSPLLRGVFCTMPGPMLAGRSNLHIEVIGGGGHGAWPHTTQDPVPAIAELTTALNVMVARCFDVFDPVVVSVTQLEASNVINVIPDRARLGASVRTLSRHSTEALIERVGGLASGIAAAHGCTAEVTFEMGYPVTVNDETETRFVIDHLRQQFGDDRVEAITKPRMGSEDFSFVLDEVPGTFLLLGASPPHIAPFTESNHSPRVQFDDAVLGDQAAALASLAWHRLSATV